ncbi:fluoride efflux transporter FluC [Bacillus massilinigeriensis]|uniref:fluoride efflux transporter FluC n=1 Tax=Bacillus mediterraneensis TaxID=1805474 RepID=UPI0008F9743A|nr:CrcB family protein [Bacillus mediterraneensis]
MTTLVLISIGGFLGAVCRYFLQIRLAPNFTPYGTIIVNLTGSLFLGFLVGGDIGPDIFRFAGTGFMGAFTTFSTINIDILKLWLSGSYRAGISYLTVTYLGGFLAIFLGYYIGGMIY